MYNKKTYENGLGSSPLFSQSSISGAIFISRVIKLYLERYISC